MLPSQARDIFVVELDPPAHTYHHQYGTARAHASSETPCLPLHRRLASGTPP